MTPSTDRRAEVPARSDERALAIDRALGSLAGEQRRLERLGLAGAAERCRTERRYWSFLSALFQLADAPRGREAA